MSDDTKPKKGPVIHVRRFMGGRMSPFELWQAIGVGKRCEGCGGPAVIRIKTYIPEKDLIREADPRLLAALVATNPAHDGTLPGRNMREASGTIVKFIKMGDIGACALHRQDAEVAASKHPDFWFVEIDRGPDQLKPRVGASGH